jgi:hypothetical protein
MHWVIVRFPTGATQLWRDYGHVAWGSPAYRVLGYVTGQYRDARRFLAALPATADEWGEPIVVPAGDS